MNNKPTHSHSISITPNIPSLSKQTKDSTISNISDNDIEHIHNTTSTPHKFLTQKHNLYSSRHENSLGELTKNFIKYIKHSKTHNININDLVTYLHVKKRRIYDITNVLEGIGYIKKHAKNEISWISNDLLNDNDIVMHSKERFINDYKDEIKELEQEKERLDSEIKKVKDMFTDVSNKSEFRTLGFVSVDDLKECNCDLKNLFVVEAPKGTVVDMISQKNVKHVYNKAKKEMENGKEGVDMGLLDTLKKEHHLFVDAQRGEIVMKRILNDMCVDFNVQVNQQKIKSLLFDNVNSNININESDNHL
jgi:transcription factor E2F3